jgi:phosphatidylglycerol---prolipoprotein diacylglyceryl transferase
MYPNLFTIGDFTVTTFGLMMFLAFVTAAWVTSIQLGRRGLRPDLAWDMLLWVALGGILGAKLYYVALHWEDLLANPMGTHFSRAGLVWYGGLIGGVLAYYWLIRRRNLPLAPMFDSVMPALMLSYAVGRMGCFLVGDDYGVPTESWVGIAFPEGAPPTQAGYLRAMGADIPASVSDFEVLAVHPTQLYEVGAGLLMFGILWKLSHRALRSGQLFAFGLGLYGIERFLIEFVRLKDDIVFWGLSTSQLMSVIAVLAAVALWQKQATAEPVTHKTTAMPKVATPRSR